jgi:hypothetical protein
MFNVRKKQFFGNEHVRMALALVLPVVAAPMVAPSNEPAGLLSLLGWFFFAAGLALSLWPRVVGIFNPSGQKK